MNAISAAEILRNYRITTASSALGRYYAICPECSLKRKQAHQKLKCLGVTIESEGVKFGCNHCGWTGGQKYKHRGFNNVSRSIRKSGPVRTEPKQPDFRALDIWGRATEPHGTFVQEYLERRGITLLPQFIGCQGNRPAMVAAVQDPDGKIIAVQQTWLTCEGKKASISPPRITTGSLGTGAVRLGALTPVLGLAEGVETALSAMMLTGMTVWATLGAARMHNVWIPPEVRELYLFTDNDEAGRKATQLTVEVHRLVRRVVPRAPPDQFKDYNDYLNAIADRDGRDLLPEWTA